MFVLGSPFLLGRGVPKVLIFPGDWRLLEVDDLDLLLQALVGQVVVVVLPLAVQVAGSLVGYASPLVRLMVVIVQFGVPQGVRI